jgi:hypothetical protein
MLRTPRIDVPKPNDPVRETAFNFIVNATGCANSSIPFECVRNAPAAVLSQANKDVIMVSFFGIFNTKN